MRQAGAGELADATTANTSDRIAMEAQSKTLLGGLRQKGSFPSRIT